jgi:hypothetical protein
VREAVPCHLRDLAGAEHHQRLTRGHR